MRSLSLGAIIYILLFAVACNPVKKVLKNPTHFEEVAKEVVRRGYCINDTITHDTLTTTIVKDSLLHDTIQIHTSNQSSFIGIDTLFPTGAHLSINQNGFIKLSCPTKQIVKTATINHFIRDIKREQLLQQDIDIRDGMINELNLDEHQYQLNQIKAEKEIKEIREKLRSRTAQLIGLIILFIFLLAINVYKKVRSAFPL